MSTSTIVLLANEVSIQTHSGNRRKHIGQWPSLRCVQRSLQNLPMFLFRASIPLSRPSLQRQDQVSGQISYDQLRHGRKPQELGY
jgi:hypothetical protein